MLVVITGPSGSGKSTIAHKLSNQLLTHTIKNFTSRAPRNKDDYYNFITRDMFCKKLDLGEIVCANEYNNNLYGTPKDIFNLALNDKKIYVLMVDMETAFKIAQKYTNSICFFILCTWRQSIQRQRKDPKAYTNKK